MKFLKLLLFSILVIGISLVIGHWSLVVASHCPATDYDCQISEVQREIDALSPAHEKNKADLAGLRKQLADLGKRITSISGQLTNLEKEIAAQEGRLGDTKLVFEEKTNHHYRFIRLYDPLLPFFSASNASQFFKELKFRQRTADEDRKVIEGYSIDLVKLRSDKELLSKSKISLASAKSQIAEKESFLAGEVQQVEKYLGTLSSKQQELQATKAGGFSTSVGDTPSSLVPCSGPPGSSNFCDPGFRPAFGGFSFGAPHRTGMSQYGAYGRSKLGQSAETILGAYYQGAELKKDYQSPATIGVTGYGQISFEDNYLLGIYEVPESWGNNGGFEALKAQAVAARSYALAVTGNGAGTICTTESCQVYKPQLKSGKWREAVMATRGWVMMKGGSVATTYYASTSGGYTINQWGWSGIKDAPGDWPSTAYEKNGGSPWFYMGWFKSKGGQSCGRNGPWLTGTEMADIINAWKVLYQGVGDVSRISPVGACWDGNPYSISELQSIGGHTSASGASVIYSNSGVTQSVTFQTNSGSVSITGEELKKAFNLRAPGFIGLKSGLFNIEKL